MSTPDPSLASLAAKVAAHASWAQTPDRSARTAKARAAAWARFEHQVDPDGGTAPPGERRVRAEHARKEHLARISLRSAKVRRLRAELAQPEQAAAANVEDLFTAEADAGAGGQGD